MKIFKFYLEYIEDHPNSKDHGFFDLCFENMPKKIVGDGTFFRFNNIAFKSLNSPDFMNDGRYFCFLGNSIPRDVELDNTGKYYSGKVRVLIYKENLKNFNNVKYAFDRYTKIYQNSFQLEFNFDKVNNNIDYELVKSKTNKKEIYGIRINISRLDRINNTIKLPNGFSLIRGSSFNNNDNTIVITNGEHRIHFSSKEKRDSFYNSLKQALDIYKTADTEEEKSEDEAMTYIKRIYKNN